LFDIKIGHQYMRNLCLLIILECFFGELSLNFVNYILAILKNTVRFHGY